MHPLDFARDVLASQAPLILDGGLATELERRGHDVSGPLWSARLLADAPEAIEQLHYDYFDAGARCVISASYQASFEGFAALGLDDDETEALLVRSIALARGARERYASSPGAGHDSRARYVAASVGPYGATRHDGSEYHGEYGLSVAQLIAFHARRFQVLAESDADVVACETIPSLEEVRALLALARDHPGTHAWVSCTSHDGAHTAHGEPLGEVARLADDVENVVAVGVNCVRPEVVLPSIRALRGGTDKPIVAYPNSGEQWNAERRGWDGSPSAMLEQLAPSWVEAGARIVGGCCRTGPAQIAWLARHLDGA